MDELLADDFSFVFQGGKMSIPKYFEMHVPFLQFLEDGNIHRLKELKEQMKRYFNLSDAETAEMLPSGRQTVFANRIGWAGTYLKKAGLVESPARASFVITEQGKKVLADKPAVIDVDYLMKFDSFREFQKKNASDMVNAVTEEDKNETPDDIFEEAFQKINKGLQDMLMSEVMKLSPVSFERMVIDLMSKMGYGTFENAGRTTPVTGDEGIDGIIMEDKLGFDLIYIQAKKWSEDHTVGRPEIQAFVGAIAGKGGKGLFVTTSRFSKQAREYAEKQHIILMDGEKLTQYMIEYNFGVSVKKAFEIKTMDMDVFDEYSEE